MPRNCTSPTTEPSAAPLDANLRTAHELRTIIQSLRLVAEQLALTELSEDQQRLHGVLAATIRDAEGLIASEGLGTRARGGSQVGAEQTVSAHDVVREVIAVAEVRARQKGIGLLEQYPATPLYINSSLASVLRLSARNLISNAITHTDEGTVTVALSASDTLDLSVTDTGSGIAPEDLPYVFVKGFRAGGSRNDGGFGLAIVKEAVEGACGEVAVVETSTQGTRFVVRLPMVESQGESRAENAEKTRGRVLIADDSASIRELLAMIITAGGYEVVVAEDGAEAAALAAGEVFAVVILDQDMPSLSGSDAAARILADAAARGAASPALIALSGARGVGQSDERGAGQAQLWQERWHKPIGREAILAGLARVIGRPTPTP